MIVVVAVRRVRRHQLLCSLAEYFVLFQEGRNGNEESKEEKRSSEEGGDGNEETKNREEKTNKRRKEGGQGRSVVSLLSLYAVDG